MMEIKTEYCDVIKKALGLTNPLEIENYTQYEVIRLLKFIFKNKEVKQWVL